MTHFIRQEDEWQGKATASAIAEARKTCEPFKNTPIGRLSDREWGWIVAAAIFGWIECRAQQAIAEGRDAEEMIRSTGLQPDPRDVTVVNSILPELAEAAKIDWSQLLSAWPKDTMIDFLILAWRLLKGAELMRNGGKIRMLPEFKEETGDPIPF
jgi:hypothetical protein